MTYPIKCLLLLFFIAWVTISAGQNTCDSSLFSKREAIGSLTNFHRLSDSIFRSEQPKHNDLIVLSDTYGVKSVLNFRLKNRKDYKLPGNEHILLKRIAINPLCIGHSKTTDSLVIEALHFLKTAPKPVLIHCKKGADRTGMIAAMYRIIFQHRDVNCAIEEMLDKKNTHFSNIFRRNIPGYIRCNYQNVETDYIKRFGNP